MLGADGNADAVMQLWGSKF